MIQIRTYIFAWLILPYYLVQATNVYKEDLTEIYRQISENHPGIYNTEDSDFVLSMQKAYQRAMEQIVGATSLEEYQIIMDAFIQSFHDTHLGINWSNKVQIKESFIDDRHFEMSIFGKYCYWIKLPTFALDNLKYQEQKRELEMLLSQIKRLHKAKKIVFDLRGNTGGNSAYGSSVIDALFGISYADQQRNKYNALVTVDWRASYDNVKYLSSLSQLLNYNRWILKIAQGMQCSLQEHELYYHEAMAVSLNKKAVKHKVRAKIFVIIDQSNVSAALDFLDELYMMDYLVTLIGQTTKADRVYMELRTIDLPSGLGSFYFPIKVYRNRLRKDNEPYYPDIFMDITSIENLQKKIQSFVKNI